MFDAGEVVGFFAMALIVAKTGPLYGRSWVLALPLATLILLSIAAPLTIPLGLSSVIVFPLVIAGGCGYAVLLMLWLELYGCLDPRRMLVAWSGSYILSTLIWLIWSNMASTAAIILMASLPFGSLALLIYSFRRVSAEHIPSATMPPVRQTPIPCRYIATITGFVFAIGAMDIITGRAVYSTESRLGMIAAETVVIVGALFFPTRFELKSVLTLLPVATLIGTAAAFLSRGEGSAPHAFLVMGSECCLIVSYTVGCALAYRLHCSAVVLCGIFAGLNKLFLQAGKLLSMGVVVFAEHNPLIYAFLFTCITVIIITATTILVRSSDLVDRLAWEPRGANGQQDQLTKAVQAYNLTPREASVVELLVQGKTTAEIAEELFCAQSTVRAHMSNANKKMGVHSREELLSRMAEL